MPGGNRDRHSPRSSSSSSGSSSASRRYPPIAGSSSGSRQPAARRPSTSSGSDHGVFHMSGDERGSPSSSSSQRRRRPSVGGGGGGGFFRGGDSSSSSSSSPSSGSARQPSSRHTGSGSGSGSNPFESRSASHASSAGINIPLGTGGRREIVNQASRYPGSGHSDHFKPRAEASTGQSYDSWKSDASVRHKYDGIKAGEESWKGRSESYERRLDNTPSDRGGRGESYPDFNKNLSTSQHERYGRRAEDTLSSISRTADRRVELNQDYSKEQLKKGLMTGHNTIRGHDTRVGRLEAGEDDWKRRAEKHYDYAESGRRGTPSSQLADARAARESRTARAQPGAEGSAYGYGDRLRRDGRATEDQLRAAGWDTDNRYTRDTRRPGGY